MKGGAAHRVGSGAERLRDCSTLTAILKRQAAAHMPLTAMCASPAVVLSAQGLLGGVAATVHPAFAHQVPRPRRIPSTRKEKLRIGREMAHAAVSRRTTVYLYTSVRGCRGARRESVGFVHRSRTGFCRPVPNPKRNPYPSPRSWMANPWRAAWWWTGT
jgi:putative intracellular protease/amidase